MPASPSQREVVAPGFTVGGRLVAASPLLSISCFKDFALGEEIGWRGFALPKLLASHNRLAASLIVGVPWALVHLTLFLPEMMYVGRPVLAQVSQTGLFAILLTWAFVNSGQSVLAPTQMHGAFIALWALLNSSLTAEQAAYLGGAMLIITPIVLAAARPSYWLRSEAQVVG
ncbi:MAG: CPBP family intramembrane glutamic endopeptidase [Chloroflexota bacterium]